MKKDDALEHSAPTANVSDISYQWLDFSRLQHLCAIIHLHDRACTHTPYRIMSLAMQSHGNRYHIKPFVVQPVFIFGKRDNAILPPPSDKANEAERTERSTQNKYRHHSSAKHSILKWHEMKREKNEGIGGLRKNSVCCNLLLRVLFVHHIIGISIFMPDINGFEI